MQDSLAVSPKFGRYFDVCQRRLRICSVSCKQFLANVEILSNVFSPYYASHILIHFSSSIRGVRFFFFAVLFNTRRFKIVFVILLTGRLNTIIDFRTSYDIIKSSNNENTVYPFYRIKKILQ